MSTLDVVICVADVPNKNNRLYPLGVCKRIAVSANKKPRYGTLNRRNNPSLNPTTDFLSVSMDEISHVVTDFRVVGQELRATVEILRSPCGRILQEMHDAGIDMAYRLFGQVDLIPSSTPGPLIVRTFKLIEVVAMPAELAA